MIIISLRQSNMSGWSLFYNYVLLFNDENQRKEKYTCAQNMVRNQS